MKLFNEKKTRYRNLLLVLIPFLLLGGFFGFTAYRSVKAMMTPEDEIENSPKFNIADYGYQLRANATDLQYNYFQELIEELQKEEVDDVAVAASVAKNFVADFYTWSNKGGMYDVGGMCYVYSAGLANIYMYAKDSFYHYLNYYIDEYGSENLPEVANVEIVEAQKADSKFGIDGVNHPCYFVRARWSYVEKEGGYDTSSFWTEQDIYVIKNVDSGRYEIVQMYEVNE